MNYHDTYEYNRRTMNDVVALTFARGRYKAYNARSLGGSALLPSRRTTLPNYTMDGYDYKYDRDARRNLKANLMALRLGVSTKEQRQEIASTPWVQRGYGRSASPGKTLSPHFLLAHLNRIAGSEVFCFASRGAVHGQTVDVPLALTEDMQRLYDGSYCHAYYVTESPHFPGQLFRSSDESMVDVVVDVERGRYVAARVPRELVKSKGAVPLRDILEAQEGAELAAQLLSRITVTRTSAAGARINDPRSAWVMPGIVEQHARLFRAEFLRVNYGRPPTEYHTSAAYLRGQAERGSVTLGLEWEVGVPNTRRTILVNRVLNCLSKAAGTMEYVHAERDGSLHNRGVEFVFAYRSLDKHKQIIADAFAADAALPQRNQTLATRLTDLDSAGIHVHVGTATEGGRVAPMAVWARMANVVSYEKNREFMRALFGRRENHYSRHYGSLLDETDSDGVYGAMARVRYNVVNLRSSTVEIRGFRSGTSPEWLMVALEFADALRNYAGERRFWGAADNANAHNFVSYVVSCEGCYPNLINHLKSDAVFTALAGVPLPESMEDPTDAPRVDPLSFLRNLQPVAGTPTPPLRVSPVFTTSVAA